MSVFRQVCREPLVQFLAIGAILFAIYRLPGSESVPWSSNRIAIGAGEVEQLRAMFIKQRQRPPTEEELRELIDARIQEEVLYREALAMGLDRDDTIVKRRLAQKLEFLTEDLTDIGTPTEAQLAAFFAEHGERYQTANQISFVHIYFSTAKRGEGAVRDAKDDLARLRANGEASRIDEMGDAFLLEYDYRRLLPQDIEKIFGQSFAEKVLKLSEREWNGPLASGYGLHLVKVSERLTGPASTLDAVREQVTRGWLDDQRRQIKTITLKKLRDRYDIFIDNEAVRERAIVQSDARPEIDR
jgi:peptidyl-prolyl cis-trans isomerase C